MKDAVRSHPPPATELRVEDVYRELRFPTENPWDFDLPYIAINMVSSLDGRTAVNGTANSIGGTADRRVMRNLRSRFDAVLRGAGTLRADKISLGVTDDLARLRLTEGREAQPLDLIMSSDTAELPLDNLLNITPGRVAALVPLGTIPVMREDISTIQMPATPGGMVDILPALKTLKRDYDIHSLLLEGGPSLNHSFICREVVNDLFLTIAPKLIDGASSDSLTLLNGEKCSFVEPARLELISSYVSGDELFLHYTFQKSAKPSSNTVNFR